MALRGNSGNIDIPIAGATVAHGLKDPRTRQAVVPDEIFIVPTLGVGLVYRYAAPDSTNVYVAAASAAMSGIVYYAKNHSFVA